MIYRHEYNIQTGDSSSIEQLAYRDEGGSVIVLDAIDPAPEGFEPFDPYAVDEDK